MVGVPYFIRDTNFTIGIERRLHTDVLLVFAPLHKNDQRHIEDERAGFATHRTLPFLDELHAAFGAITGLIFHNFRVHRAGVLRYLLTFRGRMISRTTDQRNCTKTKNHRNQRHTHPGLQFHNLHTKFLSFLGRFHHVQMLGERPHINVFAVYVPLAQNSA